MAFSHQKKATEMGGHLYWRRAASGLVLQLRACGVPAGVRPTKCRAVELSYDYDGARTTDVALARTSCKCSRPASASFSVK
jgi:hypothetical protein